MPKNLTEKMRDVFAELKQTKSLQHHRSFFRFGKVPVQIDVIGDTLNQQITRPFNHLKSDKADSPQLVIKIWDEQKTDLYSNEADFNLGTRWEAHEGIFSASECGRYLGFWFRHSVTVLDREKQEIIGYRKQNQPLSRYEISKPFFVILSVWYYDQGIQLVHAGLVAFEGSGVLFTGKGGVGKSTSSLSCVSEGFDYLGDDFVGFRRENEEFMGQSLYNSACITEEHLKNFPQFLSFANKVELSIEDKATLFLNEIESCNTLESVPIKAIALPRIIDSEKSRIKKASSAQAMLRLAPSTMLFVVPNPGKEAFEKMTKLVESVPSYWLEIGRDLKDIAEKVRQIIEEAK